MIYFNYHDEEIVGSPAIIVSGKTDSGIGRGVVQFVNNNNTVFPPQNFEVNSNGHFKGMIHLAPGEQGNRFQVRVFKDAFINPFGFPENLTHSVDQGELRLQYMPAVDKKAVHMCVIVGRDSRYVYDMPRYKLERGESPTMDLAIQKLKVAGRIMQAFTHDEMKLNGFGNRTWHFEEETEVHRQTLFGYTVDSPTPHSEVKVHVLVSPKSVAELRDPNLAQQNPHASDSGGLFSHAIDLISNSRAAFNGKHYQDTGTAMQCAVMYLDATYDTRNNMILTHAALGGGTGDIKLAIFGSHGMHSWPDTFPQITSNFLDQTHLSTNEVANDCNECGTTWECLNITLGAFMHEIGHALGCPHQVNGVMLRDYVWLNRSFMTRELESLRIHSRGQAVRPDNGQWPSAPSQICHWHRNDAMRFLFHDSFGLVWDFDDKSFKKIRATTTEPNRNYREVNSSVYRVDDGVIVRSEAGIYLIELIFDDLAKCSFEYLPQSYGGKGLLHETVLNYHSLYDQLKRAVGPDAKADFSLKILSIEGDHDINNFKKFCEDGDGRIHYDFGLGRGNVEAFKSSLLGRNENKEMKIAGFNVRGINRIRVFHAHALYGLTIFYNNAAHPSNGGASSGPPPLPGRNYLKKSIKSFLSSSSSSPQQVQSNGNAPTNSGGESVQRVGNETNDFSDYVVPRGEYITKLHIRNGAWIDGIQFETNRGTVSPFYGNQNGGGLSTIEAPSQDYEIVGIYGYTGDWMDGIGIYYAKR